MPFPSKRQIFALLLPFLTPQSTHMSFLPPGQTPLSISPSPALLPSAQAVFPPWKVVSLTLQFTCSGVTRHSCNSVIAACPLLAPALPHPSNCCVPSCVSHEPAQHQMTKCPHRHQTKSWVKFLNPNSKLSRFQIRPMLKSCVFPMKKS